ncbi:MAG: glycosyl transferase [Gammaproteobacteria bacterium]|jgi:dolichol-phosphate mannosyltransferase|nr:glycosyl transferase [Gammaproteobacteria bacterium]HEV7442764.1 glycosyltransferase family 2 protein [Steroidobacteraceae bacterium]
MPEISIVVPTFSEAENIAELHARLSAVLGSESWELIFVDDDSPDGTANLARELSNKDQRVRCIQRIGRRGLSTAVVEGALSSSAPYVAVMDADLQHDESILPAMLHELRSRNLDIVVGSRYVAGGGTGNWDESRKTISRIAGRMAKGLVPEDLHDPMSGFFAVRSEALRDAARRLSGYGYKILLDLFVSAGRPLRFAEVPYTFKPRVHGQSKLDSLVAWEYLMLLVDKRIGHIIAPRLLFFLLVGGSGVALHYLTLSTLFLGFHVSFTIAQLAGTVLAMTSNFFLNNLFTYRDQRLRGMRLVRGLLSFYAVCGMGALANIGIAAYAFSANIEWALSAAAGIVVGTLWNYLATARFTWGSRK